MKNDRFKAKLDAVAALRDSDDRASAERALREALSDRSNFIVAKAASIAGSERYANLRGDLIAAYDRFVVDQDDRDAEMTDPTCRAKIAIVQALTDLGEREPDVFLRGLTCVQMEAAYGPKIDTAGPVRARCVLALVATTIDPSDLLVHLADRLFDTDKAVRVEATVAIAQIGAPASPLILRVKARAGDAEPEVIGQCFASLLELEPSNALAFVAGFLAHNNDELRFEAVHALAQTKADGALPNLIAFWQTEMSLELRRALVGALAASPHRAAAEFLLRIVGDRRVAISLAAISAIGASRFSREFREPLDARITAGDIAAERELFTRLYA